MNKQEIKDDTIKLYHRGDNYKVSQIISLVQTNKLKVVDFNLTEETITPTQLERLVNKSSKELNDFIDQTKTEDTNILNEKRISEADLLQLLSKKPSLLKTPIAELQDEVMLIESPTEILTFKNIDKDIDGYNHNKD